MDISLGVGQIEGLQIQMPDEQQCKIQKQSKLENKLVSVLKFASEGEDGVGRTLLYLLTCSRLLNNNQNDWKRMFGENHCSYAYPAIQNVLYFPVSLYQDYIDPSFKECSMENSQVEDSEENQVKELRQSITKLRQQLEDLAAQNKRLKANFKPKRKYSKRRENLVKKFTCMRSGCTSAYSSRIALHCHMKKKHGASGHIVLNS